MNIEMEIKGLKCDKCDYREDDVKFSEYKGNIGRPCPVCGTTLLTKEEYNNCLMLIKRIEFVNMVSDKLKWINPFFYFKRIFKIKDTEKEIVKINYPSEKIK